MISFYAERSGIQLPVQTVTKPDQLKPGSVYSINVVTDDKINIQPGSLSSESGKVSMKAVKKGISFCLKQKAQGLVTAPISKEAIQKAGYKVPGHTEYLAEKTSSTEYMMMLVSIRHWPPSMCRLKK